MLAERFADQAEGYLRRSEDGVGSCTGGFVRTGREDMGLLVFGADGGGGARGASRRGIHGKPLKGIVEVGHHITQRGGERGGEERCSVEPEAARGTVAEVAGTRA